MRGTRWLIVLLLSLLLSALVLSACGEPATTTTLAQTTTSAQTTSTQPAVPTTVALSAPSIAGTIAFNSPIGKDDTDICVVNTDGTGLTTIAGGDGMQLHPRWSPDGSRIVNTEEGSQVDSPSMDLWVVNADGSGRKLLYDGSLRDGWATWSPDGTQIAWTGWTKLHSIGAGQKERAAVFVMNADGSDPHSITSEEGAGIDYWPMWATDGKISSTAGPNPRHPRERSG